MWSESGKVSSKSSCDRKKMSGRDGRKLVALTGTNQLLIYVFALVGAGIGAGVAFAVAKGVPGAADPYTMMQPPPPPPTFG